LVRDSKIEPRLFIPPSLPNSLIYIKIHLAFKIFWPNLKVIRKIGILVLGGKRTLP